MRRSRHLLSFITIGAVALLAGCSPAARDAANNPIKDAAQIRKVLASPANVDSAEPAVAADAQGNIYVAYVEYTPEKAADLYVRKFDSELRPDGEKVRVNPQPGTVKSWRGDQPTIKIAGEKMYVGWNWSVKKDDKTGNDLMLSVSADGSKSFAAPVRINDDSVPASHGMHGLEVDGDKVYFVWLDERYMTKPTGHAAAAAHDHEEPNAELYFAASSDGGKTFSKNIKVAADICPCCKVQTVVKDGRLFFSWRQVVGGALRHIAVSSTADGGATFAEPAIVSDDQWKLNACPVSGAPLAIGSDGALHVAWYTAGEAGTAGLYSSKSKDEGKTFSPRLLLAEGAVVGTSVLLAANSGAAEGQKVIWTLGGKVLTTSLDSGNAAVSTSPVAEGELPSAVMSQNSTFIALVSKERERRSVWLLSDRR